MGKAGRNAMAARAESAAAVAFQRWDFLFSAKDSRRFAGGSVDPKTEASAITEVTEAVSRGFKEGPVPL